MTPVSILENIKGIRANLHTFIILAATLTQQILSARESLKQTEDNIIAEIWSDEQYKNDRARNEQKRLARINDDRYLEAAAVVQGLEMDRARTNADILVEQNRLTVATADYQHAMQADMLAGLQFKLIAVDRADGEGVSIADTVKPEMTLPGDPADTIHLPVMAAAVLDEYLAEDDDRADLPELAEIDRKICDIARGGETRFLDGAALQRVRDLYATLPPVRTSATPEPETPATSPVEAKGRVAI